MSPKQVERATLFFTERGGRAVFARHDIFLTAAHTIEMRHPPDPGEHHFETVSTIDGPAFRVCVLELLPVTDIAALTFSAKNSSPGEVRAFEEFRRATPPVELADRAESGQAVLAFGRNCDWIPGTIKKAGILFEVHTVRPLKPGASGGPVITPDGRLVGLASTADDKPLQDAKGATYYTSHASLACRALPAWIAEAVAFRSRSS